MTEKKKKPTVESLPNKKVSKEEAANVKGGMTTARGGVGGVTGGIAKASDSCKETTDTGIMGCAG